MYSRKQTFAIYAALLLSVAFAGAVTWLEMARRSGPGVQAEPGMLSDPGLRRIAALPPFELVNQDGSRVTLDDFKGRVWLADFVYTTCPGPCPVITAHMAALQRQLPPAVLIASFSTDPANDTPAVLKAYAKKFNATDRWSFLTGPKEKQYDLINHGFLMAAQAPPGAPILHSTQIALVDKYGVIRAYYDGVSRDSDAKILADIKALLAE